MNMTRAFFCFAIIFAILCILSIITKYTSLSIPFLMVVVVYLMLGGISLEINKMRNRKQ